MVTNIWGIKGESSGGAGTGGLNGPVPDGTPDGCREVVSDVAPIPPLTQIWLNVVACSAPTTPTDEWVLQGDATYTEGSIWRVSKFNLGSTETCVQVSGIRSTELIADGAPGIGTFPATPSAAIICGGYATCAECSALCYKLTDCVTAAVTYSNSTALAGVTGFRSVIDGRCYNVEAESDISQCCPSADTEVSPAGTYTDCATCDAAINPDPCGCNLEPQPPPIVVAADASCDAIPGDTCFDCFGSDPNAASYPWISFVENASTCTWTWGTIIGWVITVIHTKAANTWDVSLTEGGSGSNSYGDSSARLTCGDNNHLSGTVSLSPQGTCLETNCPGGGTPCPNASITFS